MVRLHMEGYLVAREFVILYGKKFVELEFFSALSFSILRLKEDIYSDGPANPI